MDYDWIFIAHKLQAIAQNGLLFSKNDFDIERYQQIKKIAAEIISNHTDYDCNKVIELFNQEVGYATPKLDVRAAVFKNDKILLVQEKDDYLWSLPGGWVDINESASEAAVREVYEESGYNVKAIKLIALYDKQKHKHPPQLPHTYKAIFLCNIIDGESRKSIETCDINFFSENDLPFLSNNRILASQIKRAFTHLFNPNLPTEFD